MRLPVVAPLLVAGAFLAPGTAQAAQIASARCVRFTENGPVKYVPVQGIGFTTSKPAGARLTWPGNELAGYADIGASGGFLDRFSGPTGFLRSSVGGQRTYTLTATDTTDATILARKKVTFVHAGLITRPRKTRPHGRKTSRFSGFPSGKKIWAHYVFGGKLRATRYVGKAKGACGKLSHHMPLIPVGVKSRVGEWKIYFSNKKRFTRRSTLVTDPFFIYLAPK
jgi:hypothetical protein